MRTETAGRPVQRTATIHLTLDEDLSRDLDALGEAHSLSDSWAELLVRLLAASVRADGEMAEAEAQGQTGRLL